MNISIKSIEDMKEKVAQTEIALKEAGFDNFDIWPTMGRGENIGNNSICGTIIYPFIACNARRRQEEVYRMLRPHLSKEMIEKFAFVCLTPLEVEE